MKDFPAQIARPCSSMRREVAVADVVGRHLVLFTASIGIDFPLAGAGDTLVEMKRASSPLIKKLLNRRFAPAPEMPLR